MSTPRYVIFPGGGPQLKESQADYARRGGFEAYKKVIAGRQPEAVIEELEKSRLRGRGGAGFPTHQKLALCRAAEAADGSGEKYVVVNGGEDEPGSHKDRVLLTYTPQMVLEGTLLAAYAIGAQKVIFYVNESYESAHARLRVAINEATVSGYIGQNVLGSGFNVAVEVVNAPHPYVAGEDTAVLEFIEGRAPKPRQKPPYPVTAGLYGKPTIVNNVETFANIGPIMLHGGDWYRAIGTEESSGTMLFTLNDEWTNPGVYELPFGASEGDLLNSLGGGLKSGEKLRAFLPGGPSSAFLMPDPARLLSPESLRAAGSSIGCGVMRGYGESACIMCATLEIAAFFKKESCGQCPACQMETNMLFMTLDRLHKGQLPMAGLAQIPTVLAFNKGKGFCSLVNMPGPPITSAIKLFSEDFEAHSTTGKCRAR
jgi:NADH-quinone oxidoreductase subunit F